MAARRRSKMVSQSAAAEHLLPTEQIAYHSKKIALKDNKQGSV